MYQQQQRGQQQFRFLFSSYWSNSSYEITNTCSLELGLIHHRTKMNIMFYKDNHKQQLIQMGNPLNMMLLIQKNKWYASVVMEYQPKPCTGTQTMGIDLGIKVPAVAALSTGEIQFFGNGREIRFRQRQLRGHIQHLQKTKQYKKLKEFEHKLHRVLTDYDHKISKEIIDFAINQDVSTIKLEKLTGIVHTFDVDLYHNIYLWSYRRLQEFIVYKAKMKGIRVQFVNP